jgi:3-hydroxyacyl-CoA dehydrogenase
MNFQKVAVVGSGTMGCGIAQVLSQAGLNVLLTDIEQDLIDKGLANIKRMYESRVRKEALSQAEADRLYDLVKGSTKDEGFADVDLVIEAALEKIEVKIEIFRKLDRLCPPQAVLASNTSSLSISEIATATKRPSKVLGMHFFNPAQVMKLVEVIPGVKTSTNTVAAVLELCRKLGKIAVKVNECPGFLVNRVLFPYINEALYVLQEGQFMPEDVDQAAITFGLPMGPFALLDMTGLDVCANVNQFLHDEYGVRFETAAVLPRLVKHGFFGQKTKAGIYVHSGEKPQGKDEKKQLNPQLDKVLSELQSEGLIPKQKAHSVQPFDIFRVVLPMFNEAVHSLQESIVAVGDIDVAMLHGTGLKRGLLTIADEKGLAWCHEKLEQYRIAKGERFRPSWYLSKLVRGGVHDFREIAPVPVGVK